MNPVFYFGKADIRNPLSLLAHECSRFAYSAFKCKKFFLCLNKNIIHKIFPAVRI